MKGIILTIKLAFFLVLANAQLGKDPVRPDLFLESQVSNNVLLYRLLVNHEQLKSGEFTGDGFLKPHSGLMYYLPPSGARLKLEFTRSAITFPDSSFVLYEVLKSGDIYDLDSILLESELPPVQNDKKFLVAYDSTAAQVLFLSGNFFLTDYSQYFRQADQQQALWYLRIKYFYLDNLLRIVFLNETKGFFLFRIFLARNIYFDVKLKKVDYGKLKISRQKAL